ncbi:MAG TPA: TRAP transporter small permease [Syntrophales bacterium]|nr:TRAP transporter small permease [Syntrophales bacterium]HOX93356.1 TRAP transporter small permease [Syntrophales bacterium]HPI56099.1 TRAP transporter small permease [Syntrophales bacterium]HPN24011.1 TRAP transporter small permease [Syntrophales bacterium]HQM28290.1 TRAP transporter small permease [Syntrophales bacterium]
MSMPGISRLNDIFVKAASGMTAAAMAVIAVVIPYEVFGRYVLGVMPVWSGEAATYALVWASMMGSAVGLKKGYQVSLNILVKRLPKVSFRVATGCMYTGMLVFLGLMTWFGVRQTVINMHQLSTAIGIPMSLPYLALPAGFAIMLLITIEQCWIFFHSESEGG